MKLLSRRVRAGTQSRNAEEETGPDRGSRHILEQPQLGAFSGTMAALLSVELLIIMAGSPRISLIGGCRYSLALTPALSGMASIGLLMLRPAL